MKIFNIIFIFLFIVGAALQYNDPDPYIWIPIYLYGAFVCYRALQKKYNPVLYLIGFIVYIGYAAYLFFDKQGVLSWIGEHNAESLTQSMKATEPWIEETREFGGLFILIVVMLINMVWLKKINRDQNSTSKSRV